MELHGAAAATQLIIISRRNAQHYQPKNRERRENHIPNTFNFLKLILFTAGYDQAVVWLSVLLKMWIF